MVWMASSLTRAAPTMGQDWSLSSLAVALGPSSGINAGALPITATYGLTPDVLETALITNVASASIRLNGMVIPSWAS